MSERELVAVIDDDESVRESLPDLLREFGFAAEAFASAEEFLASGRLPQSALLLLDLAMPGMSGIDLKREIYRGERRVPIVFITAHGDEEIRVSLRDEAVECLLKPFSDTALLEAIQTVMKKR